MCGIVGLVGAVRRDRLDLFRWFANGQDLINAAPAMVTEFDLRRFVEHRRISPLKRAYLGSRLRAAVRRHAMLLPMSQSTASALHDTQQAQLAGAEADGGRARCSSADDLHRSLLT